ncbi:MAG: hypothetical protein KJS97_10440 [Alphaproteobacteria bacterium]|nr:hypothetical protein [Alphaproteobacteria bacterium]
MTNDPSDERDDFIVVRSYIPKGMRRFFALIHQSFGVQYPSFDDGVAAVVSGFHGEEAREAARDIRAFLAATRDADLLDGIFKLGAGYWAFNDDIRGRLEGVAAELERRANQK